MRMVEGLEMSRKMSDWLLGEGMPSPMVIQEPKGMSLMSGVSRGTHWSSVKIQIWPVSLFRYTAPGCARESVGAGGPESTIQVRLATILGRASGLESTAPQGTLTEL